jgi:hypothetical protein
MNKRDETRLRDMLDAARKARAFAVFKRNSVSGLQ